MSTWEIAARTSAFVAGVTAAAKAALSFGGDLSTVEKKIRDVDKAAGGGKAGLKAVKEAMALSKVATAAKLVESKAATAAKLAQTKADIKAAKEALTLAKPAAAARIIEAKAATALAAAQLAASKTKNAAAIADIKLQKERLSLAAKVAKQAGKEPSKSIWGWFGIGEKTLNRIGKASHSINEIQTLAGKVLAPASAMAQGLYSAAAATLSFAASAASGSRAAALLALGLTGSAKGATEYARTIDYATRFTDMSRDSLAALSQELRIARIDARGTQLILHSVGMATTALGEGAGSAIKGLLTTSHAMRRFTLGARDLYGEYEALKGTGLSKADVFAALAKNTGQSIQSVEQALRMGRVSFKQGALALEAALKAKFGKTIELQLLSASNQFNRFKENLGLLFRNVNIEPLLKALQSVLRLFDQNTAAGKAMQTLFTVAFTGLANTIAAIAPYARAIFIGMAIGALQLYIALKPAIAKLKELLGGPSESGLMTALKMGKYFVFALAAAFTASLVPIALLGSAIYAVGSALAAIGGVASRVLQTIASFIVGVVSKFKSINLLDVAKNLMKSFADAITAGAGWVWDAIKGVGKGIVKAVMSALEIGSPSKVMKRMGRWTLEGYVQGVEAEAPTVQRAFADIKPAALSMRGDVSNVTNNTRGAVTVNNYFTIQEANDSKIIRMIKAEIGRSIDAVSGGGFAMEGGA